MRTLDEVHEEATRNYTEQDWERHNTAYEEEGHRIDLAQLFYKTRKSAGLSQKDLARRMRTTQSAIARIESGGASPRMDTVERLAKATGKQVDLRLVSPA